MTDIKITYTQNAKGKYDFIASQNGSVIYEKTYSPVRAKNQHLMSKALVDTLQQIADEELKRNPNFMWESFEEFKSWAGNSETRKRAVNNYKEQELVRVKEANKVNNNDMA